MMFTLAVQQGGKLASGLLSLVTATGALVGAMIPALLVPSGPALARTDMPDRVVPGTQRSVGGNSASLEQAARYENGESVSKDYGRARALYCNAARQGNAQAALSLAWVFLNGRGVRRDDNAAAFWLHKAAAQNVLQAVNLLKTLGTVSPIERGCAPDHIAVQRAGYTLPPKVPALIPTPAAYREVIDQTAHEVGVSPTLLTTMVAVESAYNAHALSPKGAMGLMQLMPGTAERFQVQNPFDYRQNLRGGAKYIRWLLGQFGGDLNLALAAYNAGEKKVVAYRGIPPFPETQAYVKIISQLCGCTVPGAAAKVPLAE